MSDCQKCGKNINHLDHSRGVCDGTAKRSRRLASNSTMEAATKPMNKMSAKRAAQYEESGYYERSAAATQLPCAFWLAGAVSQRGGVVLCDGHAEGQHHIASRSQYGFEVADRDYPKIPACNWHNSACEQDVEVRAWAETTCFEMDYQLWPFRLDVKERDEWPKDARLEANRHAGAIVLEAIVPASAVVGEEQRD